MNVLQKVDGFFLHAYQSFADRVQKMFGVTCFSLAKIILFIAPPIMFYAINMRYKRGDSVLSIAFDFVVSFATYVLLYGHLMIAESVWKSGRKTYSKNVFVWIWCGIRLLWLGILGVATVQIMIKTYAGWPLYNVAPEWTPMNEKIMAIVGFVNEVMLVSYIYFASCTPKPPSEERETHLTPEAL